LLVLASLVPSQALLLEYEGTFVATFGNSANDFSGSYSFLFDDSVVNPVGTHEYGVFGLTSLVFSPDPYGIDSYNGNPHLAGAQLQFIDGTLEELWIGGIANGVTGVFNNSDDFSVRYNGDLDATAAVGGNQTAQLTSTPTGTSTVTVVPEPASASLLIAALGGLALRCRRKK